MRHTSVRSFLVSLACTLGLMLSACGGGGDSGTAVSAGGGTSSGVVASIRVTPETMQIAVTETKTLTAQALDANGAVVSGLSFSFNSANPAVATVGDSSQAFSATIKGVAEGVTTIIVTAAGKSVSASVTVRGQPDIQVTGRVIDGQTNTGLAGARVELPNGSFATAGSDGAFAFTVPFASANPDGRVVIKASLNGYLGTSLATRIVAPSTVLETILLVKSTGLVSSVTGVVRNARNNQGIANASVFLSKGQGGSVPESTEKTTDSNGTFSFTGLESGVYSIFVLAAGYSDCGRTVISLGSNATAAQDVPCSPIGQEQVRIVLTWGANPTDLDAHLTGPNASDANRFHIYYPGSNRGAEAVNPFAILDVDDRSSFGPETLTLTRLNSGVYRYSVHDFTNRNSATSTALGSSSAKVELYVPGNFSPRIFYVPNQRGTLWTVFELTGSLSNVTVTTRNEMGLATEEANIP